MQWIFLIGNQSFGMKTIKNMQFLSDVISYDVSQIPGRYCVDFGEAHVFFDQDVDLIGFEDTLSIVPFGNPSIITVTFTSRECVEKILTQKDLPQDIYVDNDHGLVMPLKELILFGTPLN